MFRQVGQVKQVFVTHPVNPDYMENREKGGLTNLFKEISQQTFHDDVTISTLVLPENSQFVEAFCGDERNFHIVNQVRKVNESSDAPGKIAVP